MIKFQVESQQFFKTQNFEIRIRVQAARRFDLKFKQYNLVIIKDNISNAIFDFFNNKCYFRYMEILDITHFEKALTSLESILNRYEKDNFDIDIRDAVIQRFEYTYSLALKMIIRFINMQSPEVLADMTFNEAIRKANKLGLLKNNLEKWTEYRQKRTATSHTYDEKIAIEVVSVIPDFKDEAEYLLAQLKKNL